MTADSEIEMLLNEQPGDSLASNIQEVIKIQKEDSGFFDQLIELDFVLPLQDRADRNDKFMMSEFNNPHFIDFFSAE